MKQKAPTLTYPDIQWLEDEFLPKLARKVKEELSDKLDDISKKLDTFIGDIGDKREAQELHAKNHSDINNRLEIVEKHIGISP